MGVDWADIWASFKFSVFLTILGLVRVCNSGGKLIKVAGLGGPVCVVLGNSVSSMLVCSVWLNRHGQVATTDFGARSCNCGRPEPDACGHEGADTNDCGHECLCVIAGQLEPDACGDSL